MRDRHHPPGASRRTLSSAPGPRHERPGQRRGTHTFPGVTLLGVKPVPTGRATSLEPPTVVARPNPTADFAGAAHREKHVALQGSAPPSVHRPYRRLADR